MYSILVADDHELIRETLKNSLVDEGYRVHLAGTGQECLEIVKAADVDLVLLDMRLPDISGIDVLQRLRETNPDVIVMMMTAYGDIESTRRALNLGAFDFIHKPVKAKAITSIIKMAMEIRNLRQEVQQFIYRNKERYGYHNIIGKSEALQKVLEVLTKVANSDASTILIEGASGTGKSLIAKCLHYNSLRAHQPFVEINCASIPGTLLESELFGYEAGAFTDAKRQKKGLVEMAHGGTLFLDEIGEMEAALQAKVLQLIEEKCFRRIGGTKSIAIDVRIVAATNRDLKKAVENSFFRSDLYYRLNVIDIHLPSLRERKEDIIPLVEHFIGHYSRKFNKPGKRISEEARDLFTRYDWPGNVRELLNVVERVMILEDGGVLLPEHIPLRITKRGGTADSHAAADADELSADGGGSDYRALTERFQSRLIARALGQARGNKTEAARMLGLSRLSLYHQMKKLGMVKKGTS
ncbi:MAG: sigma-54-dependent Fis family transcriptional regulator [Syntrophobacterales bacterium]|nr:sigma-54-dependent Fis family transcriptional regulator [Syntrophobacterales bacterium]